MLSREDEKMRNAKRLHKQRHWRPIIAKLNKILQEMIYDN